MVELLAQISPSNNTVQVECAPGFYLDGPGELTCNENAAWVGGESCPICIGNLSVTFYVLHHYRLVSTVFFW